MKVEENSVKEFDETEHREAIRLNELMQELKLEEENEEDELKNFEDVVKNLDKIDLGK